MGVVHPQSRRSAGRNTYPHKSLMWGHRKFGTLCERMDAALAQFAYKVILRSRDQRYRIRSPNEKKK